MTIVREIRRSKILKLIWYGMTVIIVFKPSLLNGGRFKEATNTCVSSSECNHICKKYGTLSLQLKEECNHHYINLDFERKTSIINITMNTQTNKSLIKSDRNSEGAVTIKVNISEPTVYDGGIREDILQEVWAESEKDTPISRHYLSRTSNVSIILSSIGIWSHHYITFTFDEILYSFKNKAASPSIASGVIKDLYEPNSISLYSLKCAGTRNKWKGITITIGDLNVSKEMGEYMLIGSGAGVYKSENYPPLYVTEAVQNSSYYVDNSNAFVAFVSGPIQKNEMLHLFWKCEGTKISPNPKDDNLGVLNSSLICFYNFTEAMKEFQREDDEKFKLFRQNFANAVITFLVQYNLNGTFKNADDLNEISVELFGQPTAYGADSNILAILIKVVSRGKSIFTWRQLQRIIEIFEQDDKNLSLGYKVGKCPEEENELPYKDKWSFIIYALVPVFGFVALLMWAWKQDIFAQKCTPEKEKSLYPAPLTPPEPNPHGTTPKVYLYDDRFQRQTLIEDSFQPETERQPEEIAVEMNVIASTSQVSDTTTQFLTNRKSKHRPSIQPLINKNGETRELPGVGQTSLKRNESEHLYDLVSSNVETDETNL